MQIEIFIILINKEVKFYVKKFTGDFETAVWKENETWVWAWACCEIGNEKNLQIGN